MLYNTKLNEFTVDQIDFLLYAIEAKIQDVNYGLSAVDFWEDSELKHVHEDEMGKQLDAFVLWKVQLLNAKEDIKEMNKVNAG